MRCRRTRKTKTVARSCWLVTHLALRIAVCRQPSVLAHIFFVSVVTATYNRRQRNLLLPTSNRLARIEQATLPLTRKQVTGIAVTIFACRAALQAPPPLCCHRHFCIQLTGLAQRSRSNTVSNKYRSGTPLLVRRVKQSISARRHAEHSPCRQRWRYQTFTAAP